MKDAQLFLLIFSPQPGVIAYCQSNTFRQFRGKNPFGAFYFNDTGTLADFNIFRKKKLSVFLTYSRH